MNKGEQWKAEQKADDLISSVQSGPQSPLCQFSPVCVFFLPLLTD